VLPPLYGGSIQAFADSKRGVVFSERSLQGNSDQNSWENSHGRKQMISKHLHTHQILPKKKADARGDYEPINPLFYHGGKKLHDSMDREDAVALTAVASKNSLMSVGSASMQRSGLSNDPSQ